jgi:rhomboid protease GluP
MPHAALPKTDAEGRANAADLVARWPGDPRAHYHRGMALVQARDLVAGERELRIAATQADDLRFYLGGQLATAIHGILAALQLDLGDAATAKQTARPACDAPDADRPSAQIRDLLDRLKLCE